MARRWIAGLVALPLLLAGCDWAQPGHDGANTGSNPAEVELDATSVAGLHQLWSATDPSALSTQLVEVGDTVYSSAHDILVGAPLPYFGGTTSAPTTGATGPLRALAAADGTQRWAIGGQTYTSPSNNVTCKTTTEGRGPVVTGAAVQLLVADEGCVFNGTNGVESASAWVVDPTTGAATPAPAPYDGLVSSVVAAGDGSLYAVRRWLPVDAPTTDLIGLSSIVGPGGTLFTPPGASRGIGDLAVDSDSVYAVDDAGTLWAVDRATGSVRWHAATGAAPGTSGAHPVPSIAYGRVFVSTGAALESFDEAGTSGCSPSAGGVTCAPIWSTALAEASTVQAPALRAGRVLVRSAGTLWAFSAATGLLLWSAALGAPSGDASRLGAASVGGTVVFVGAQDGRLLAFDLFGRKGCAAAVCSPVWSAVLSGPPGPTRPVIADRGVSMAAASGAAGVEMVRFGL